ncbi:MAG: hypothetical protein OXI18_00360 [bacterium]|nr:hypothetical protein [bacterium]
MSRTTPSHITQPPIRDIIHDFRKEILTKRWTAAPPTTTVINFRDDEKVHRERPIYNVPIALLRYRKENGRICSSVLSHERAVGPLSDTDQEAQDRIATFLREKDPEKTDELRQLILADGQKEPAIVTCDGFIIDGNRRRVVIEELRHSHPHDQRFESMKVVILPGPDDEGGPPTIKEIEQIENRYQLQRSGKAEYYGFDAALSIRAKIKRGFPLEDQLRDDPQYKNMGDPEFKRVVRKKKKDLLDPLDCIDRYLDALDRPGHYEFVSTGIGDPEGRWQAFVDYATFYRNKLQNRRNRANIGVDEREVPTIEQAAFKVIRLRTLPGLGKVHTIMRALPKYCHHAKDDLVELNQNVKQDLPATDCVDSDGNPLPLRTIDQTWANKYTREITYRIRRAQDAVSGMGGTITSLNLLRDAHKKLTHADLDISTIPLDQLREAQRLTNKIQARGKELAKEVYDCTKQLSRFAQQK